MDGLWTEKYVKDLRCVGGPYLHKQVGFSPTPIPAYLFMLPFEELPSAEVSAFEGLPSAEVSAEEDSSTNC